MRTPAYLILLVLALLLAGFLGTLTYYTYTPQSIGGDQISKAPELRSPNIVIPTRPIVSRDDPIRGNASAPLTIVEFGDFLCPACAEVESALNTVLADYADRVRLVWKDLPNTNLHPLAKKAAEAARCAGEQGQFWQYHDRLFETSGSSASVVTEAELPNIARGLNLNLVQFSECLTSGKTAALVERTFQEALLLRVDGTPYFFIGTERITQTPTLGDLKAAIDAVLTKENVK